MLNRKAGLVLALAVVASIVVGHRALVHLRDDSTDLRVALWEIIDPPDQSGYFPPKAFSTNFASEWYEAALLSLDEPSIRAEHSEAYVDPWAGHFARSYRFLWLPSFRNNFTVRVDWDESRCEVTMKEGTHPHFNFNSPDRSVKLGHVIWRESHLLDRSECARLDEAIRFSGFWTMKARQSTGVDGTVWMLEARSGNEYHVHAWWEPEVYGGEEGQRFADLGHSMLRAAGNEKYLHRH